MEQAYKDSLKVQAFTQRIAQLVSQYEDMLVDYRAEATGAIEGYQAEVQRLTERVAELEAERELVSEEDTALGLPQVR